MAVIATFGTINIDDTELIDFNLELSINYAMLQKQRNNTLLQHTGLSFKRATLVIKLNDYNSYIPWDNLLNNYNKLPIALTIAGNTERSWIIESNRITLLNLITPQWECTLNLIG